MTPDPKPMNEKPSETPRTDALIKGRAVESSSAMIVAEFVGHARTIELETQALTRRLAEAEKERDEDRKYVAEWNGLMSYLMSLPAFHDSKREGHNANRVRLFIDSLTTKLTALRTAAAGARDALEDLRDHQNGCPLPKYEAGWNAAMASSKAALAALRAELEG